VLPVGTVPVVPVVGCVPVVPVVGCVPVVPVVGCVPVVPVGVVTLGVLVTKTHTNISKSVTSVEVSKIINIYCLGIWTIWQCIDLHITYINNITNNICYITS
jgi:hypothetical protein